MAARKVPAKKVPAKKVPAKRAVAKKTVSKNTGAYADLTPYQKALSVSAEKRSSVSKGKLKPYDAKWKANAKKQGKRSRMDKIAEGVLEFSPLGGLAYAAEAVTGKSMRGPMNKPAKKVSRLGAAGNAAFYLTPVGAAGKVKKAVKTVRSVKGASETLLKTTGSTKSKGEAGYNAYVNQLIKKEIAKYNRANSKKGKK